MTVRKPRPRYGLHIQVPVAVGVRVRYLRDQEPEEVDMSYTLMDPDIICPEGDIYGMVLDGPETDTDGVVWQVDWENVNFVDGDPVGAWWTLDTLIETV